MAGRVSTAMKRAQKAAILNMGEVKEVSGFELDILEEVSILWIATIYREHRLGLRH